MSVETKGLFGQLADTITGKKDKTIKESNPVVLNTTNSQEGSMAKPQSYYTVKEHTFKNRKGEEVKDYALFLENELMTIEYKPMPTVPAKQKHIKLDGLKDLASILDLGLTEQISTIIAKDRGYKELVETLADQKVMTLDFLTFIKEEIKKIPAKPRGRAVGSGKAKSKSEPDVRLLVTMLSGLAPNESPKELANRLSNLVEDEVKMEKAVTILEEKEKECGRKEGYIQLRIRKTGKIKAKK